jgi:hypothetical protein
MAATAHQQASPRELASRRQDTSGSCRLLRSKATAEGLALQQPYGAAGNLSKSGVST